MLIAYLVLAFFITGLGAMFMGIADYALVITFGVINICIANLYFKIKPLRSILVGFLISAIGLILSYILWIPISNLNVADDIIILGLISNAIFQTLSWWLVDKYFVRKDRIKTVALFLSTAITIIISFNLHDFWKFERYYNWNEKKEITLKVIDAKTGKLIVGDSIGLSAERQPLYGLMTGSIIKNTTTDENGISGFEVYLGKKHIGRIWRNGKYFDYFEINSNDLIENDTIEIKTTANTSYK